MDTPTLVRHNSAGTCTSSSQDYLEKQQLAVGHQELTGLLQGLFTGCIGAFAQNSLPTSSFTHTIAFACIIVVVSTRGSHTYVTSQLRSTSNGNQREDKGVVRIFVGLSCEPGRLISYLINYMIIYITWNNFSPTRSVSSGNRTPGSRFYSDLLDTLADSICIHQLVLKPGCSYNCRRLTYGSFQLTHMSRDDYAVQLTEPWRPKRRQNIITSHRSEFRHVRSVHNSDYYDVDRIFVGLF